MNIKKYIIIFLSICITERSSDSVENATSYHDSVFKNVNTTSEENKDDVQVQLLTEIMVDVSVLLAAQMGSSLANQSITKQGQLLAKQININNQTIQTSMQTFQSKQQIDQQAQLQDMINAFSQEQQSVQTQIQQASTISQLELDYIYKHVSTDQPEQNYIFNNIEFDQLFSQSKMLTPEDMEWKNPFAVGDWEYEKNNKSFWQYQSFPISTSSTGADGNNITSSLKAENNMIFTEYYTALPSYTITGSITLYQTDYPFYAGIIFNKARWVSGDFEAIRKCRMVGIYGQSPTNVGLYFAEQYTMTDAQLQASGSKSPIQTPLQQIINGITKNSIPLAQAPFAAIRNKPVIINFEIITSTTNVHITCSINNQNPITMDVPHLDPTLFTYHGIGFICPGAIAEFRLTAPQDATSLIKTKE